MRKKTIVGIAAFISIFVSACSGSAGLNEVDPPSDIAGLGSPPDVIVRSSSCVVFGLSHFAFAAFTADMIPQWLPERLWLAYLTGAGHVAAGVGFSVPSLPASLRLLKRWC
jgi:hypothetical protein